MLLDVDGVLNASFDDEPVRLEGKANFHPGRFAEAFMRWAWPRFEVVWCTCWQDRANLIARWAGLPERLALRPDPREPHPWSTDWKALAAARALRRSSRPVVWVEDGFTRDARRWAKARGRTLLVETEPLVGVGPEHCRAIARWLARRGAAIIA